MREIKFRGVTADGRYVYGYAVRDLKKAIHYGSWYIVTDMGKKNPVLEYSIEQYIGRDENGKEVYEGDPLYTTDHGGSYCRASIRDVSTIKCYKLVEGERNE